MGRTDQSLIYLDTHILVWLYSGMIDKLTKKAKEAIENSDIYISQIVRLELQYLYEINRIKATPARIINYLSKAIGLKISKIFLTDIIDEALKISWTRDVFDRLIVAEASISGVGLITADKELRIQYKNAVW